MTPDSHAAEYAYDPTPADAIPPIGQNMLMHLFEHPGYADVTLFLYDRSPRKLRRQLEACPRRGSSVGWDVRFVEGLDW
ncbi:Uu.00g089750.m01.CDS01 [Anthostomella pinea]|uniref:Uu.00g089750.m01.CDS01 n=1 Tax=Anthostomella pinea TaxID=933095 RepID=A0AAI8VMS9_9PEZI|nr:Uu.00g089750.m01.CDS01 [Anthostomella pinea]